MEFTGPLWQSHVKLWRARSLLPEVERQMAAYRDSSPIRNRTYTENGQLVMETESNGPIKVGAVIGDVFHNLRSALDLMACALARENDRSDKGVYFPFADGEGSLEDRIKDKRFDRAGPAAVALLREFAPYRGGNDALRAVHDYNVQDKHNSFVETKYRFSGRTVIGAENEYGQREVRMEIDNDSIELFFAAQPFTDRPVIPTLEELVELVDGVVEEFTLLIGQNTPANRD